MRRLPENARILVVKFNAIGDVVMTTPVLRDLRAAYPRAHITMMVGSWSAPVIRSNPHLNALVEFDPEIFIRRDWAALFRLLRTIRSRHFDCAIILHALLPIHVFMRLAGIPLRFGMARKGRDFFLTDAVSEEHDPDGYYAEKYQQVAALAGATKGSGLPELFATDVDESEARAKLDAIGIDPGQDFLVVAPGGGRNPRTDMEAKRWPLPHYAGAVRSMLANHPHLRAVLIGAESDREETGYLAREIPGIADLTGHVSLPQLVCIVRSARAVLCNDSSVMHIGVASGTPVVVPFGPTSARQLLPAHALDLVRQSDLACSPCYRVGSGVHFPGCPIGHQCMRDAGVMEIRPLLERALVRTSAH